MKKQFALLAFSAQKIDRQYIQMALMLVALAMLVIGVGAPSDGSGGIR
ncbi:MAG: hypothetical protein U0Z26_17650 [Anaerolineales bacterium]